MISTLLSDFLIYVYFSSYILPFVYDNQILTTMLKDERIPFFLLKFNTYLVLPFFSIDLETPNSISLTLLYIELLFFNCI